MNTLKRNWTTRLLVFGWDVTQSQDNASAAYPHLNGSQLREAVKQITQVIDNILYLMQNRYDNGSSWLISAVFADGSTAEEGFTHATFDQECQKIIDEAPKEELESFVSVIDRLKMLRALSCADHPEHLETVNKIELEKLGTVAPEVSGDISNLTRELTKFKLLELHARKQSTIQ